MKQQFFLNPYLTGWEQDLKKERGLMSDKVRFLFFDKEMREMAEKYGPALEEDAEQEILKALKDPEQREFVLKVLNLIENGDMQSIRKIFHGLVEKKKEIGQDPIGVLNRKGVFICAFCLVHEKYNDPTSLQGFETIISIYDVSRLKVGSFYQCDDCKKKFNINGITD